MTGKDQSAERQDAMTELEFGYFAARIAQKASTWSADIVQMEHWRLKGEITGREFADPHAVARFTDEIRKLVDHMDKLVGRGAQPSGQPQSSDDTFPMSASEGGQSNV